MGSASPSRRRIVAGAAWSVPAVVATAAAPAFAASPPVSAGCNEPISWWTVGANQSNGALPNPLNFWAGNVRVTVTNSGANTQSGTFYANNGGGDPAAGGTGYYQNHLRLRSETNGGETVDRRMEAQFVTFTFSQPVTGLSFFIRDIDRNDKLTAGDTENVGFRDQVYLVNSPTPTRVTLGSGLEGSGTASQPWETQAGNQGNQATGSSNYDVGLEWSGPVTSVTIAYKQGTPTYNSFPTVWISPLRFSGPGCS